MAAELPTTKFELPNGAELGVIAISELDAVTEGIATDIVRILGRAYTAQYEPNTLPTGAIAEHRFDHWNEEHIERQADTMRDAIENNGSVYWIARQSKDARGQWTQHLPYVGVAKTTPSRRLGVGRLPRFVQRGLSDTWARPNLFFNDLAVDPDWQSSQEGLLPENRPHIGAALAYAALSVEVGRGRNGRLITDITQGSGLTSLAVTLGLKREIQYVEPFAVGDNELRYDRFATPDGVTIDSLRAQLAMKYPHTRHARTIT